MILSPLSAVTPPPSSDALSLQTALLILLTAGVLYCAYAIAKLRRRIERLAVPPPAAPPSSAAAPVAPPAPVRAAATLPATPPALLAPEIVAVISAAVHASLGRRHRIVSVLPALAMPSTSWSVEGRRDVFSSHHVR